MGILRDAFFYCTKKNTRAVLPDLVLCKICCVIERSYSPLQLSFILYNKTSLSGNFGGNNSPNPCKHSFSEILSRWNQGFDSPWEYQTKNLGISTIPRLFSMF